MKIIVDSEDFKRTAEKAMSICLKKWVLPMQNQIHIFADDTVSIKSYNGEEFVTVNLDATVIESGYVSISADSVKKLFNVKGCDILLECEAGENPTLKAHSDKKKSAVPAVRYDREELKFADFKVENPVMNVPRDDLLETLSNLKRFLDTNSVQKMMSSYHFTNSQIETMDSHRVGIRQIDWSMSDQKVDAVVPAQAHDRLKKLIDKHEEENIKIFFTDRYAVFKGSDFEYYIKTVAGKYWDVSSLRDKDCSYAFRVDCADLQRISKEYAQSTKNTEKPMIWYFENGTLKTFLFLTDYETYDDIDITTTSIPNELIIGLKPEYVKDAIEIMSGEVTIKVDGIKTPIYIIKDDYKVIILPVNINGCEYKEKIKNFA